MKVATSRTGKIGLTGVWLNFVFLGGWGVQYMSEPMLVLNPILIPDTDISSETVNYS